MTKHFYTWFTCCLFALMTVLPVNADEVTVNNGTATSSYVPVYGLWVDNFTHTQFVIPADSLSDASVGTISSLKFYSSADTKSWGAATFEVRLTEIAASSVSSFADVSSAELVYSGALAIASNEMPIAFTTAYAYAGGNLLVDVQQTAKGSYSSASFYGLTGSSYSSCYGYNSSSAASASANSASFAPKVTLTYEAAAASDCAMPGKVTLGDVTTTTAAFSWTAADTETSWGVVVKNGTTELVNTTVTGTPEYTITGLNHSTAYSLSVAITRTCGDESATRNGSLNFTTVCAPITSLPWSEDFDNLTSGIPVCWDNSVGTASTKWTVFGSGHSGKCVRFDSYYNTTGATNTLKTPEIVLPNDPAELFFWCKNPEGGAYTVSIIADGEESPLISSGLTGLSSWTKKIVDLTDYAGKTVQILFKGTSNYSNYDAYLYLDDVRIRKIPTCLPVKDIRMGEITKEQATVTWTPGTTETKWNVIYKLNREEPDTVVINNTPELVLTGLQAATRDTVAITIQADCGNEQADDLASATLMFNTACEVYESESGEVVFDFEDLASTYIHNIPCWDTLCPAGGLTTSWYVTSTAHAGTKGIYLSSLSVENKYGVLVTPAFLLGMDQELSVFVKEGTHSTKDSVVFWINDQPTLEGATRIGALNGALNELSTSWAEFRKTLPEDWAVGVLYDQVYILVQAYAYNSIYVDDITLREKPSCSPATGVKLDSVGSHAIRLAWTAGDGNSQWSVTYSSKSGSFSDTKTVNEPKLLISGLNANIDDSVFVEVTAICGANTSDEVCKGKFAFHTPAEPTLLPYSTNFDNSDDNAGWSLANPSTNKWFIGSAAHSGASGNGLYITNSAEGTNNNYTGSNQLAWAYRPFYFDEADAQYSISFDWKAKGESSWDAMFVILVPASVTPEAKDAASGTLGTLSFSRSTTVKDAADQGYILFVNDKSGTQFFNQNESWYRSSSTITVPAAGSYNLCFAWFNDGVTTNNPAAAVDSLVINKKPCKDAKGIQFVSAGTDTAVIAWAPTHASYSVKVMNDTVELAPVAIADTAVVIRGLKPSTAYTLDVALVGICSETAVSDTLKKSVSFATACAPLSELPWSEDFEASTNLPICWDNGLDIEPQWYVYAQDDFGHSGDNMLMYDSYGNDNMMDTIATPEFALPAETAELGFWYLLPEGGKLTVAIEADDQITDLSSELGVASPWSEQIISLEGYEGKTARILFIGISNNAESYSTGFIAIDDVRLRLQPACAGASNLKVDSTALTTSSVGFKWESEAASFKVFYKDVDSTQYAQTVVNTPAIKFENLEAGASYSYDLMVVAVCAENAEAIDTLKGTFNVATKCETITQFPWSENFDDIAAGNINLPCWSNEHIAGSSTYVFQVTTTAQGDNSTNKLIYPDMSSGNSARLTLPEMNIPAANAYEFAISVYRAAGSSSYSGSDYYDEGLFVMNGNDTLAFIPRIPASTSGINVPVETADGWYTYSFTLANAGVQQISLVGRSKYGSATYADNLKVREIPTCFPASNLHGIDSLATTSSVSFGWTPNSDETSWRVVVKNGETELKNEVVTDTVYTITGLDASKSYALHVEVYVKCGEIEAEALEGTLNLATLCDRISAFPWVEDFDAMAKGSETVGPRCWDIVRPTSHANAFVNDYSSMARGTKSLFFRDGANGKVVYAVLPEFAYAMADKQINFFYKHESTSSSGPLSFGYMTDLSDEASFHALYDCPMTASWTLAEQALSEVPADARLAFKYGGSGSDYYYCGVDSIVISQAPACHKPGDVKTVEVTPISASFTWTGNADNYSVEIFNGATRLDSVVVAADALPFVIDTLQSNTSYAFRFNVFGICGGEDGNSEARSTLLSIKTPCGLIPAGELPFEEDFEDVTTGYSTYNLPECWSRPLNVSYPYVYNYSYYAHNSDKSLYFYGGGASNPRYVVLPGMESALSGLQIAFWYNHTSSYAGASYGSLTVGVMSNPSDTSTFVAIQTLDKVTAYTNAEVILAAAPANCHYIAFRYAGGTSESGYAYVDDINVSVAPSCLKVKNLAKASVTANEASFTWESQGSETAWKVVITDLLHSSAELFNATVSSPVAAINDLTANTRYSVRVSVKAVCGEEEESEAVTADFTFRTEVSGDMVEAIGAGATFEADFSSVDERGRWLFAGEDETNHFIFGTDPAALRGDATHGLYVSNNDSAWAYTINSSSASMAWRIFSIADDEIEGNDSIRVEFEWQAKGESNCDYARAFIVAQNIAYEVTSSHTAKVAGVTFSSSNAETAIPDVINLHQDSSVKLNLLETWQSLSETITLPAAGQYKLLFVWQNDGSVGNQKPFGVGNVKITNLQGTGQGTSVNTVENGVQVVKFINNGRVYILRDGVVYDILGTTVR